MIFTNKTVLKLFEAFSIQRWNDLIRPFDIVEMDKSAEKTFLAFIIGKYEEKKGAKINWIKIIEGALFELLRKIAVCDIKAPVQRLIREQYPAEYKKINEWIFDKYRAIIDDEQFLEKFKTHLFESENKNDIQLLVPHQKPHKLITEIEKLRFQIRWNQTPRVPATTVLGHSFYVAALTLLMSYDLHLNDDRIYNNFFSAMFHDLPEAVTRDIISPVKQATDNLPEVVKEIEDTIVEKELLPLMDEFYREEVVFYIQNEFDNKIFDNGKTKIVNFEEFPEKYSDKIYRATDGRLVRLADQIAAFVEADSSIRHGITSVYLQQGRTNILRAYPVGTKINSLNTDAFFNAYR